MIKMLVFGRPLPQNSQPFHLPEMMASVIDCVGGAGWATIIVIINKTASREPPGLGPGLGLGRKDHSSFVSRPGASTSMGAGLRISERAPRMGRRAGCLLEQHHV